MTVALQYQRPDLFFLHAAVVAWDGRVAVLPAPPGTGKSTLTLALLGKEFTYLSDELAPIDVRKLLVHPYPHALCLKSIAPQPLPLPATALQAGERFHVPAPDAASPSAQRLAAFVFLERRLAGSSVSRPISAAQAAAQLMTNALNPSAHNDQGIDAAMTLAQEVPSFVLDSTDLDAACAEIERILTCVSARPTR